MDNLEVKRVNFLGNTLMAAQDDSGIVWAGIRWLCDGIGLTKGQIDRQITNIQSDRVLSKGASSLRLPTNGGLQDVFCLKLDFVPMWLAKIKITTTMITETPDVADRLEQYQLKAKDVLAAAFFQERKPLTPAELMLEQARILVDLDHKVTALEAETNSNRKKLELLTNSPHFWRVEINERIKELAKINRVAESKLRNQLYTELEQASYSMGFAHRISLKTRLTRLQNRARNQGALSEAYLSFTKLDVIAQDKQLRETFEQIVENMNRQIVMN